MKNFRLRLSYSQSIIARNILIRPQLVDKSWGISHSNPNMLLHGSQLHLFLLVRPGFAQRLTKFSPDVWCLQLLAGCQDSDLITRLDILDAQFWPLLALNEVLLDRYFSAMMTHGTLNFLFFFPWNLYHADVFKYLAWSTYIKAMLSITFFFVW